MQIYLQFLHMRKPKMVHTAVSTPNAMKILLKPQKLRSLRGIFFEPLDI